MRHLRGVLMKSPQFVVPYVKSNKNEFDDAGEDDGSNAHGCAAAVDATDRLDWCARSLGGLGVFEAETLMKRMSIRMLVAVALAVLLSTTVHANVDYSKCAEFFANHEAKEGNEKGWRIEKSPFARDRLRYVPFDISPGGDLVLHHGVDVERSLEGDNAGYVIKESVTHYSPTLESLETLDPEKLSAPTQKVRVVVERNREGHIAAITENVGLVTDEDNEIARMGERNKDEELGFAYLGTRTEFDVRAGECVPMKRSMLIAYERDGERREGEVAVFDTQLCGAIDQFPSEQQFRLPSWRVYDDRTNDNMADLLKKFAPDWFQRDDEGRGFLSSAKWDDVLDREWANKQSGSLELQIVSGFESNRFQSLKQRRFGLSPTIFSQMILAECYYHRLAPFFWEQIYWREE